MQAVRNSSTHARAVGLLLAGGMCLLPFLLPYPQLFQAEWLAGALGVAAALAALGGHGARLAPLPGLARWLIAFALFIAAQTITGEPVYSQLPLLGALYVLYAALLVWLGAQLNTNDDIGRVTGVLAACLLTGALANAAAGVIQFYGLPPLLEDIVAELHRDPLHNGAYGNIAQSNLFANYLALGGTALLYLWQRGNLRTAFALAAAALLAWACALSGSRGVLLYALWFAALGVLAGNLPAGNETRRLRFAAYGLAGAILAAQLAVPWLNDAFQLGPANKGAFQRLAEIAGNHSEQRWQLWRLAWRIFTDAPIAGAGVGEFAGAAFNSGLPPELARIDNVVWTSPHNLALQLLAETGTIGAFLALGGLCTWWWQTGRRYFAAPKLASWWIIAAAGIGSIHSMFEFPFWNAHFLGVTALLMGLGARPDVNACTASRFTRTAVAGTCAVLALTMALLLRDYVRLNATSAVGTSLTLAAAQATERDAAIMRALAHGLLAPAAEYRIMLGTALDRRELAQRVEMSARAARYFPSNAVVVRRAVMLAFDGQASKARKLLAHALNTFPQRCKETTAILQQALGADREAIEPLLITARKRNACA